MEGIEMKEKSVVIVMDEDKFEKQRDIFYNSRKTLIHVYEGDTIETMRRQQQEIEELQASCRLKQGHINHIPVIRKEYEQQLQQLQKRVERYEKALKEIKNNVWDLSNQNAVIAGKALEGTE